MGSAESIDQSSKLNLEKKSEKTIKNPTSITFFKTFIRNFCNDRNREKKMEKIKTKIKLKRKCQK